MLDTYGYKHALRICNTYRSSTAILVARTRTNIKFFLTYIASLFAVQLLTYEVECYLVKKRFCALRVNEFCCGSVYCGLLSLGDTTLTYHYWYSSQKKLSAVLIETNCMSLHFLSVGNLQGIWSLRRTSWSNFITTAYRLKHEASVFYEQLSTSSACFMVECNVIAFRSESFKVEEPQT
jgi:hypothetical protein